MGLPAILINWSLNYSATFHSANHLLQNEALQFESTHMAIVSHHSQDVSDYQQVEALVEYRGYLRSTNY
jgi:hypothetical protein